MVDLYAKYCKICGRKTIRYFLNEELSEYLNIPMFDKNTGDRNYILICPVSDNCRHGVHSYKRVQVFFYENKWKCTKCGKIEYYYPNNTIHL